MSKCEWAVALKQIGRYDEADRLLAESLDAYGNLGDEYRFERALALSRRAEIRGTLGAYDVAVDLYEEALREVHPIAEERAEFPLRIKNQILECRLHLGPPADLVDEALHQTAVSRERFGDHARMTLVSAKTAARVLEAAGRREEALSMLDELRRTTDGRGDVGAALREEILYGQGTMLLRAGRHAEASEALQLIVARRREVLGDDEPATFEARLLLASAHSKVAPPEAVEAELRVLVGETIRSLGPQHPYTSMAAITLGAFLVVRGRPEEAIDLLERACPDLKSIVGTSFETAWKVPRVLAQAYRLAGRLDDAISLLREWIVHREGLPLHDDGPLAILHIELMLTLERARRTEEARAVGLRALTLIAQGASVRMRPETFAVTHDLLAPAIPAAAETTASIQTLEATLESLRPEPTMRSGVDSASEPPR
ncbi:MAG: tetratricopeptide repeat protein [Planctomycetota bacterium JB042]